MEKFGKSQSVLRREDDRFLTGRGQYVDDTAPQGALHGYLLRSSYAHGAITALDTQEAEEADGVHLVLTAERLEKAGLSGKMEASLVKNQDGQFAPNTDRFLLAKDKVRFVGEPVAMVFADTYAQARVAADMIEFEVYDLPVHLALQPGGPILHDAAPNNVAFEWALGDSVQMEAVKAKAAHVVSF